jgi:protein gp37
MRHAARMERMLPPNSHYAGLTKPSKAGPVWTGRVNLAPDHILTKPLSWRKPKRIFVNSMSDLFHEAVPDEWIDRVFAVMALAPQHAFLVLSKRPARMRSYCSDPKTIERIAVLVYDANLHREELATRLVWPLPNVWLGVSVEDQPRADERIPILLDTPAAVRWISAEPMLAEIDLLADGLCYFDCSEECQRDHLEPDTGAIGCRRCDGLCKTDEIGIDWIVAGAESGPGARPCDIEWIRSLRDQCAGAGVPFFWKQHVENGRKISLPMLDGVTHDAFPEVTQ